MQSDYRTYANLVESSTHIALPEFLLSEGSSVIEFLGYDRVCTTLCIKKEIKIILVIVFIEILWKYHLGWSIYLCYDSLRA